jgi:hypothetical protein
MRECAGPGDGKNLAEAASRVERMRCPRLCVHVQLALVAMPSGRYRCIELPFLRKMEPNR